MATANNTFACGQCGKVFEKEGYLRQHVTKAHIQKGDKLKKVDAGNTCKDCGGQMRLLNKVDHYEYKAMLLGFRKICTKCEEVI